MADPDTDPSPQMLEHMNLLLEMDLLMSEPDWKVIENLGSVRNRPKDDGKEKNDEEDDNE